MVNLTPTTVLTRSSEHVSTELDGELILMSIEQGCYYGLASTARRIWELLETQSTFAALCAQLERDYSAPAAVIEADVYTFVAKLVDESLVFAA